MRVLYIEDNPVDADLARLALARDLPECTLEITPTLAAARERLGREPVFDVVLSDLRLPDGSGLDILADIRDRKLAAAVVMLTGTGDQQSAVASLKAGADDYLAKRDNYLDRLGQTLSAALARHRSAAERRARPLRVLYVEHNALDIRQTLWHFAQHAPHLRLETVLRPYEALSRLPDDPSGTAAFDVLLLDYHLPELDALDLIKTIRRERGLDLPIVLVTAQGSEDVAARALHLGVDEYLSKHSGYLVELPTILEKAYHQVELAREQVALRNNEYLSRDIIRASMDGFCVVDADGRFLDVNDAYCTLMGYSREELLNMRIPDMKALETDEDTLRHIHAIRDKGCDRFESRQRRKDGEVLDVEISTHFRPDPKGDRFVCFLHDISPRKRVEQELRIAAIAFESQEAMILTDAAGIILKINQAFTRLTGYKAADAVGKKTSMLGSGRHGREFYQRLWEALEHNGYWQGEIWNRRKDGKIHADWLTITAVAAPDGRITHYVGAFSDIARNSERVEEIHRLAFYDPLTELPNRRLLSDRLAQALASSSRTHTHGAVLFIDLDNFKTLNDTMGHDAGDLLLIDVAQRLQQCVREGDSVFRLGGDEFVVVLEDLSKEATHAALQAGTAAEKIRLALNQPYWLRDFEHYCSPSVGISLFYGSEYLVDELLKRADTAMYQAKQSGRNAIRFFDPAMQRALEARARLENDLRNALTEDRFRLYYQMQVDRTLRVVGAEGLLRWEQPQGGLVPPAQFIPLAEETGLILPIGAWVLESACAQLKRWENSTRTKDLHLAVNVSARQFRHPEFVRQVREILGRTAADPSRLELELTESLVLDDVEGTIGKMRELKTLGVRLSLDNFGSGQSSLSHLKSLPLDRLKIGQSFVSGILTDPSDAVLVQTILGMGKNLGLEVLAEGVETEEQLALLRKYGCPAFQGYLFNESAPAEKFEKLLEKRAG